MVVFFYRGIKIAKCVRELKSYEISKYLLLIWRFYEREKYLIVKLF